MKKSFDVEVLGYEYSVYAGAAGDYAGTRCTPNRVMDFLALSDEYADMRVSFHENWRDCSVSISFYETHDYHYWAPQSYRSLRNPHDAGHENQWDFTELFDTIVYKKLGWSEGYRKGHYDEYSEARKGFLYSTEITLGELQKLLS